MFKCKDCLHYESCSAFSKIINAARNVEQGCEYFKDREEVVEVVRCKDCQFYLNRGRNCWCDIFDSITPENHFCSYGERKDNG